MFQAHIFVSNVMSNPENIQTLSEGNKNFEGRGVQKKAISREVWGGFSRSCFWTPRVRLVSYQKLAAALLLFSLMIFYLGLAECFFRSYEIDSCNWLMNKTSGLI